MKIWNQNANNINNIFSLNWQNLRLKCKIFNQDTKKFLDWWFTKKEANKAVEWLSNYEKVYFKVGKKYSSGLSSAKKSSNEKWEVLIKFNKQKFKMCNQIN